MNRTQKIAWLIVITMSAAFVISCIAVIVLAGKYGFPKAFYIGFSFMAIAAIGGLGPLIFRNDKGKVTYDERDRVIQLKAARAGFAISYLVFGLISMITWRVIGSGNSISVNVLPQIWGVSAMSMFLTQSITVLVLYGRRPKDA